MNGRSTRRRFLFLSLALALVPLAGCSAAASPSHAPSADGKATHQTKATDRAATPATTAKDFDFSAGDTLSASAQPRWGDGLMTNSGWRPKDPDDGNGTWSYQTADGACTAQFWQGKVPDMTASDDLEASNYILGTLTKATTAQIAQGGQTSGFAYDVPRSPGSVQNRYVGGSQNGHTWVIGVRGFARPKAGVSVTIDCTSGDVVSVADEVFAENPVMIP